MQLKKVQEESDLTQFRLLTVQCQSKVFRCGRPEVPRGIAQNVFADLIRLCGSFGASSANQNN